MWESGRSPGEAPKGTYGPWCGVMGLRIEASQNALSLELPRLSGEKMGL